MSLVFRFLIITFVFTSTSTFAQVDKEKDNSKPTNVYSQLDNYLEVGTFENFNAFGYRPKLTYTPNDANALIVEVPFLYSTLTDKFGLGDLRLRYFLVPYRDYSKTLGALGASLDVYAPTGQFENGLGKSSWRVSPGIMLGLILNKAQTISIFPNLSYIYTSKPTSPSVPDILKEVDHGINFQVISSFVLSDDAFILVTPILDIKDLEDTREDTFGIEIEGVFDIMRDKFQVGGFYNGVFIQKEHVFRVFFTVFL